MAKILAISTILLKEAFTLIQTPEIRPLSPSIQIESINLKKISSYRAYLERFFELGAQGPPGAREQARETIRNEK